MVESAQEIEIREQKQLEVQQAQQSQNLQNVQQAQENVQGSQMQNEEQKLEEEPKEEVSFAKKPSQSFYQNPSFQKLEHKFWDTQPVPKLSELSQLAQEIQPHEIQTGDINQVKKDPYKLPEAFEWCSVDLKDDQQAQQVYELLTSNYVEDDDNMFRFDYSIPFLRWALMPENFWPELHIGVRAKSSQKLVGFISGIPCKIKVNKAAIDMVEINFLCVHKKLRSKRLAPVLIKEVTRRTNLHQVWQAVYTAGIVLPTPISQTRYYHRSLNPRKLIDVGFSRLGRNMTINRTEKLYKLPQEATITGLRPMRNKDCKQVRAMLNTYLEKFDLCQHFSTKEVKHFLMPQDDVIYSYVVESNNQITDFCSFYCLPSSILKHPKHQTLRAAYSYYNIAGAHSLKELMLDMLIIAKKAGFDVFNALNIMDNDSIFQDLKFGIGDGNLQYYLYNWKTVTIQPQQIGMVLV